MLRIYPSLLDRYTEYARANETWEKFWGNSETPKVSPEDFERKQLIAFIDTVNRVPFDSEAADRGTAFNELVDCLILRRKNEDKMSIERNDNLYHCTLHSTGREFDFDVRLAAKMMHRYNLATPQVLVEAPIKVGGEDVLLFGYIDELMPEDIHDIKTTSKWEFGKFRHHAQHLVYPYCVRHMGGNTSQFHYDIIQWGKEPGQEEFNIETYMWTSESYERLHTLVSDCVSLIKQYRPLITDKRVFGGVNDPDRVEVSLEKWLPETIETDQGKELFNNLVLCK